jgi:phosphonate transport system substrate-binding protein
VRPDITARTRIVWQSPEYGFPPIVAQRDLPVAEFLQMQKILMEMKDDAQGRALLERLKLGGFIAGSPRLYDGVADMMRSFGEY